MSGFALANGLTVERIFQIISERGSDVVAPPVTGFPVFLGAVPFAFSAVLFALPAARLIRKGAQERKIQRENARRAMLSVLVKGGTPEVVEATDLRRAWMSAGAPMPKESELTEEVRRMGGEPDVREDGTLIYRFADLHRESQSLVAGRKAAPASERSVGQVLFSSLGGRDGQDD
jgi:hypothetical protein